MVESWFEVGFGFWKQTLAIEGQVYWIKWVKIQAAWLTPKKVLLCNEAKCEVLKTGSKTNFKRKWPLFKKKKKKRLFSCFEGENIHCEICGILGKAKFDVIISKVTTSTASNFIKNWITR